MSEPTPSAQTTDAPPPAVAGPELDLLVNNELHMLHTLSRAICHEINNTFSGILGYAELALRDPADTELLHRALDVAVRGARRGGEFVRRLGFFAEEADGEPRDVSDMGRVAEDCLEILRPEFEHKGIVAELQIETGLYVRHHPGQIRLMLLELLQNAYEAILERNAADSTRGGVVRVEALQPTSERVELCVSDDGIGPPESDGETVFNLYSSSRDIFAQAGGTAVRGLGLALARRIAERHGGAVRLEAAPAGGAQAAVSLPLALDLLTEKPKILVVDDEQAMLSIYRRFLAKAGYEVRLHIDPAEALQAIEGEKPALIILDQIMPGMSGVELLEKMRARGLGMPVIMISASKDTDFARRAYDLGAAHVASKPVNRARMLFLIASQLNRATGDLLRTSRTDSIPGERILIAESERITGEVIDLCLRRAGYATTLVRDEEGTVNATREEYFDLVLIDPDLHAVEPANVIRMIRYNNPYTPIVAITTGATSSPKLNAIRREGASHTIEKPVNVQCLLEEVQGVLGLFRDRD